MFSSQRISRLGFLVAVCTVACQGLSVPTDEESWTLPTVGGPEASGLVPEISGQLVHTEPVGGIVAITLPSLEKRILRESGNHPAVRDLSGTGREGQLAVVETVGREDVLRLVPGSGSGGTELLRRRRVSSTRRAIGQPALSPSGEFVAFIADTRSIYMRGDTKRTFREGRLEVLTSGGDRVRDYTTPGVDRSIQWLPDGGSIVYSALLPPDQLPDEVVRAYTVAVGSSLLPLADRRVPVVHRLNVSSGEATVLCVGSRSLVGDNGREILVQGTGAEWNRFGLLDRKFHRASLPGVYHRERFDNGGAIALVRDDFVIYWGLPTAGTEQLGTINNSPLVGKKSMVTIKVTRLSTGEFQTLIPFIDPRRSVQYGR